MLIRSFYQTVSQSLKKDEYTGLASNTHGEQTGVKLNFSLLRV